MQHSRPRPRPGASAPGIIRTPGGFYAVTLTPTGKAIFFQYEKQASDFIRLFAPLAPLAPLEMKGR